MIVGIRIAAFPLLRAVWDVVGDGVMSEQGPKGREQVGRKGERLRKSGSEGRAIVAVVEGWGGRVLDWSILVVISVGERGVRVGD